MANTSLLGLQDLPLRLGSSGKVFEVVPKIIQALQDAPTQSTKALAGELGISIFSLVKYRKEIIKAAQKFKTWEEYLLAGRPFAHGKQVILPAKGKKK